MGGERRSGRRAHLGWPKHRVLGYTAFNRRESCIFSSRVLSLILRNKLMNTKDVDVTLMDPTFTKALIQFLA
jgi:hypothetical protein